jgi:hypothetical protein
MGLVLVALVLAACDPLGSSGSSSTTTVSTAPPSTPGTTLPPVVECPGIGDFAEGGGIGEVEANGSDSTTLGRISWETSDQCETFRFEFESAEGAPATSPPALRVGHIETFQVLRIEMDIEATVVTDQLVESGLVERLFVVTSLDGGMFADLHLSQPAAARVRVESSPAALLVDLRPGLVPFTGTAAIDEMVVLVSPTDGGMTDATSNLIGYSRTFEANVLVTASQDGVMVTETHTTAADWVETWGEFRLPVTLPPGSVEVFVGEASPEDGSLRGVTITLTVS